MIGVCELAIYSVLVAKTGGLAAFGANVLLSEGISDIMYGLQSFWSGSFSWSEYGQSKLISLGISVATAGVAHLMGGGANKVG
jgi:hypothetical protein